MSVFFCEVCKRPARGQTIVEFRGQYFCARCHNPLLDLGSEEVVLQTEGQIYQKADPDTLTGHVANFQLPEIDLVEMASEDLLKKNPNNIQALLGLGKRYYAKNEIEKARQCFEKILLLDPDHEEARRYLTEKMEDPQLLKKPETVEATLRAAKMYLKNKEVETAQQLLLGLTEKNPMQSEANQMLAQLYLEKGEYDKASEALAMLITQDVDNPYLHHNMGVASYFSGDKKRALSSFQRAYELSRDPELTEELLGYIAKLKAETF